MDETGTEALLRRARALEEEAAGLRARAAAAREDARPLPQPPADSDGTGRALREAEARLLRAQEAGGIGLFTVGVDDGLLHPTPQFCR
ncbi:MAG: hybrid sensor histidine kinase/response regulator, partial [Methylobacterium sp.]